MQLSKEEIEQALVARATRPIVDKLQSARVAIAGLGGLGSHIAVMLTRAGLGELLLVDFDVVDLSNLNRQAYSLAHLGQPKCVALQQILKAINPYVKLRCIQERVNEHNAPLLFGDYPLLCEAFDEPTQKAMLVNTLLSSCGSMHIVAASGMAGYGPANDIVTRAAFSRLTLCGDARTDLAPDVPLAAPRVMLCAAHQAHAVLRLILGENPVISSNCNLS